MRKRVLLGSFLLVPVLLATMVMVGSPVAGQEGPVDSNPTDNYVLDHFKCYTAKGESVDDVAFLRDQFGVQDRNFERDAVTRPEVFCNTTRKVHGDGGAGINDLRNHLTWYRIKAVFKEDFKQREVQVFNQFALNGQRIKVRSPEFLAVPTHKLEVEGQSTGLAFPDTLDHFKCYTVDGELQPVPVQLQDQFDRLDGGPNSFQDARVLRPRYLCNPAAKAHFLGFDPAGNPLWNNVIVQHPNDHLVCYEIQTRKGKSHNVLARNQFGPQQKLATDQPSLLCVPSEKREVRPNPAVIDGFNELRRYIANLPDDIWKQDKNDNQGQRNSLIKELDNAQGKYEEGDLCTALKPMNAFLNEAQALRKQGMSGRNANEQKVTVAEDLYNRGHSLTQSFFEPFDDSFFDVFIKSSPCFDESVGRDPQLDVATSDNTRFGGRVSFGSLMVSTVVGGGETWTQISLPAIQNQVGAPGMPSVPSWQVLVAMPEGSDGVLQKVSPHIGKTTYANLYPFQQQAVDQAPPTDDEEPLPRPQFFADPPFSKSDKDYAVNAFLPVDPCAFRPLGQYRDLQIGQLECMAAQYNPVTDELRIFDGVEFDLGFRGGDGNFITSQTLSPFEVASSSAVNSVVNAAAVGQFVKAIDLSRLPCFGEELLILTHPNFRSAADDLAQWKRDKGITTTVLEVGSGTPNNLADEIDTLIQGRYDNCIVRPSYVLFIGDAEWIPPARTDYDVNDDSTTGSDYGYAIYPQFFFDIFPDFAVGRIPVDTLAEAQRVVDKTIAYESDPPFVNFFDGGPFYTTASLASQFQCCRMNQNGTPLGGVAGRTQRSFIHTSEVARNALIGAGYTAERIYIETVDSGGYCLINPGPGNPCPANQIQQAYSGNVVPNRYFDNSLLPVDLRSGSGFSWTGNTNDIITAFNQGRFLFLHRDHGGSSGWSNPGFGTGNLASLSNGELLPIVYSVNCKSGYWDRETDVFGGTTESFMEQMLMLNGGGMVGGLGDVRNSPSWENSALTRGYFDATWPGVAPEFGSSAKHRRLGDILNHGKLYLATQIGVAQPAGDISLDETIDEYIMWHAFGDPTLEMWTGNPHRIFLPLDFTLQVNPDFLQVQYAADGSVITAYQMTQGGMLPIGRAMVQGGVANVRYFHQPDSNAPIMLSASMDNAVSVLLTPRPQGQPDLMIEELSLGASNLIAPGEDLAGRLNILVSNLGNAVAPGTFDDQGNTKEGYMVDVVLSRDQLVPDGFASVPDPAGVAFAEDGLLKGGRVSRTPDVAAADSVQLPAGPPVSSDVGGIVPTQAPTGDLFLCARIDPGAVVAESDETNNVTCLAVTITVPIG